MTKLVFYDECKEQSSIIYYRLKLSHSTYYQLCWW